MQANLGSKITRKNITRFTIFSEAQKIILRSLQYNLIFLALVITFSTSFELRVVFAHPGRTDSFGCHTCRTNCPKWGLSYGEYHCHRSKGLLQPKEPIKSHLGKGETGYTEAAPEYKISTKVESIKNSKNSKQPEKIQESWFKKLFESILGR